MRKYQQWQQTQSYLQHIDSLLKIRVRKPIYSPQKKKKQQKIKKDESFNKTTVVEKQYLPISNLIPKTERAILYQTLRMNKQMPLKQKQIMLQNYLNCRRILKTLPVISKKQQDEQYKIYKRASKNMNKTLNKQQKQARGEKFTIFKSLSFEDRPTGFGKNKLIIRIMNMAFIKLKLQNHEDNLLKLKIYFGKRYIHSKLYSVNDFTLNDLIFYFRKKDLTEDFVNCHLVLIKKNYEIQVGVFKFNLKAYLAPNTSIEKLKMIESIHKNNSISGTVEFLISIHFK